MSKLTSTSPPFATSAVTDSVSLHDLSRWSLTNNNVFQSCLRGRNGGLEVHRSRLKLRNAGLGPKICPFIAFLAHCFSIAGLGQADFFWKFSPKRCIFEQKRSKLKKSVEWELHIVYLSSILVKIGELFGFCAKKAWFSPQKSFFFKFSIAFSDGSPVWPQI